MTRVSQSISFVVTLSVIFTIGGCGGSDKPDTVPVSGKVTLDGVPVEGASVMFRPEGPGRPGTAMTDANGAYSLSSYGEPNDGAVPGDYTVAVIKIGGPGASALATAAPPQSDPNALSTIVPTSGTNSAEVPETEYFVPKKYTDPSTSGLKLTIPENGSDSINLELSSK
ncbi:MAG: carboxypeptidase-like regulatory domain-containing protein [Planctomycetaceae bacterium]